MKCQHCQNQIFVQWVATQINGSGLARMEFADGNLYPIDPKIYSSTCPSCMLPTFRIRIEHKNTSDVAYEAIVYPRGGKFPPPPQEVPAVIANDYIEANEVLPISPKASAALARRCLQAILSAHGYSGRDLMKQVEAVIAETDTTKALPTAIRDNVDAIRNFGNFSAHPITDQTSSQIIEVEDGEAEWCLDLLLDMFDHFYVAPAKAAKRRAQLAQKLSSAGKPPMK